MFKFRGQTKSGEWVVGWLICFGEHIKSYVIYHTSDGVICSEIHPHTLSVSFGKLDSNGVEIFASFEIDGVMTQGGDLVEVGGEHYSVLYLSDTAQFCISGESGVVCPFADLYSQNLTIIGKQGGKQ